MAKSKQSIINFLAEAGQLKRVKRSGWWVAGIKDPESVAEHSFRCAVLGYILAKMEKQDPYQVLLIALFHDIHEARTNDLHKISLNYFNFEKIERTVYRQQTGLLEKIMKNELDTILASYNAQKTPAAIIARDADILECILQAKEYLDQGFTQAKSFMSVGNKYLKTRSAKTLFKQIPAWNYKNWWLHLAKFKR
ncbi:MAG: HD domain-containing protein [Candidatus Omnitrophica bacterium]|nr:HD domain-containing protein [Candidatus Omnitrophota bacterium]